MLFPTFTFTCFFLIFLMVWWMILPSRVSPRLRQATLLSGSFVFYAWADVRFAGILMGVSILTWAGSLWVDKAQGQSRNRRGSVITALLVIHLVFWKYTDWMVSGWNDLVPQHATDLPGWVYPVGLSFFTFHAISLLAGVWRKAARPPTWMEASSHISFFPALLAGPVLRFDAIVPRFSNPFIWSEVRVAEGIGRVTLGMTFKWVFASQAAAWSDPVFAGMANHPWEVWLGVHAYALQIFFDFAGYSQMALGIALLLGFRLPENFTQPYLAISFQDFWRRWHRSLSFFFRDNLYIGVFGGNRHGALLATLAAVATMVVSGVWHGASITFFIWGCWHAGGLVIERWIPGRQRWPKWLGWLVTIEGVTWGWTWFRSEDLSQATGLFSQAFSWNQLDWTNFGLASWNSSSVIWVGVLIIAIIIERSLIKWFGKLSLLLEEEKQGFWGTCRSFGFSGLLVTWAFTIIALGPVGVPPFIYNGF